MNVTESFCKNLPKEISLIVLEFCGIVKNRNGKYMSQIAKNDVRYSVLLSIRKPRDSLGGKVYSGCCIIELRVDFKKTIDNIEYYFLISRLIANDNEGKCYKILEFIDKWRKKNAFQKDNTSMYKQVNSCDRLFRPLVGCFLIKYFKL